MAEGIRNLNLYRICKDFTRIYIDAPFFLSYHLGKSITCEVFMTGTSRKRRNEKKGTSEERACSDTGADHDGSGQSSGFGRRDGTGAGERS